MSFYRKIFPSIGPPYVFLLLSLLDSGSNAPIVLNSTCNSTLHASMARGFLQSKLTTVKSFYRYNSKGSETFTLPITCRISSFMRVWTTRNLSSYVHRLRRTLWKNEKIKIEVLILVSSDDILLNDTLNSISDIVSNDVHIYMDVVMMFIVSTLWNRHVCTWATTSLARTATS